MIQAPDLASLFGSMPARRGLATRRAALTALLLAGAAAQAQTGLCASDGQRQPAALVERFISADCADCWGDPGALRPQAGELAVDWIVAGSRGEEAPLSAAASPEALQRLAAVGLPVQMLVTAQATRRPLVAPAPALRVAHGAALNGYLGVSITLKPAGRQPWRAWLLLVEALPAGTEGSPVERLLVRGAFQPGWDSARPRAQAGPSRLTETRVMRVPEGSQPERLRVVGWVEDAQGRLRALAQSTCVAPG